MRPFHNRLATRVLLPILGFTLVFGAVVIAAVLFTTSHFTREQTENNLRWRSDAVRQIADDHEDELQRAGLTEDASARRDHKVHALISIDDFARSNGLRIIVVDEATQHAREFGELAVSLPAADDGGLERIRQFEADGSTYYAYTFAFKPWRWQLTLIQDGRAYETLEQGLLRGAWIAGGTLTAAAALFMLYLSAITRKPIAAIIRDLRAGQPPGYEGIVEFEFLSTSISEMMTTVREKTAALARYREHLEQLVDERTAELTSANEAMQASHQELLDSHRELAETHQQLLHAEKLASIGQLAAGVAHEINNPIAFVNSNLSTMDGYVKGLLSLIDTYERQESLLRGHPAAIQEIEAVKQAVELDYVKGDVAALLSESMHGLERVKKIVQALKEFSHVGDTDWQHADVHRGLDSTLNVVWNELKYKAEVRKEYGSLPKIECLPSELNQVFMNLLVNAGHAIAKNGVITLRTGCEENGVWIEIADTGSGIDSEHLQRIFDPFFTTKPVGQGTGLGLSLSYGIVQKHHGSIEVASDPGQGTTFRIHLPIEQPRQTEPA